MKLNRTFTRKNGKLEIKQVVEQDDIPTLEDGRLTVSSRKDKIYQIFQSDLQTMIAEKQTCTFIRTYIPGEFDGFKLPDGLDLSEITHTFVLMGDPVLPEQTEILRQNGEKE